MINAKPIHYPNFGYLSGKFSEDNLAPLKQEIQEVQENFERTKKFNTDLAGNIKKEFLLQKSKNHVYQLFAPLIQQYEDDFPGYFKTLNALTDNVPLVLDYLWVNFQEKYEFNPAHDHAGVMSFVIWIQIPYTKSQEELVSPGQQSNKNCSGDFEFHYVDTLGRVSYETISISKEMENSFVLFPASTSHCVYPFFSADDYRISVSGNFRYKVSEQ
jgi:hypothetical protein